MDEQQSLFDTAPAPWVLDDAADWLAARVVFAQTPFGPYDYLIPGDLRGRLQPGQRVAVPLGRGNRRLIGWCIEVISPRGERAATVRPDRLKPVEQITDEQPLATAGLLELGQWISQRWHCPLGVTLETIVPVAVRDFSNTRETVFLESDPEVTARLDQLKLSPVQRRALEHLRDSPESLTAAELANAVGCSAGPVTALRKKGLVRQTTARVEQRSHELAASARQEDHRLNADQSAALQTIVESLRKNRQETILLHGVTGSGKTEVYIRAIQQVIEFGRASIVLVPEISLTPQTRRRFCERFERVAVLHSNLTAAERAWHWRQIASGSVQVVIGARSAVFAPVPHLGMIVLDEEHDGSFKQDSAPRYHARDVARERSRREGVPLILGSATPSLESWRLAHEQQSTIVELPRRIMNLPLPIVTTIDLRGEFASRRSRGAISRPLHAAMHEALLDGGQVILLLNRRGFSTTVQCRACGKARYCPDCAIAMTHHKDRKQIVCHYCDHREPEPVVCSECGAARLDFWGVGTQRLQQEVEARFPDYPCVRMDTDSMRRPGSHEAALESFRAGEKKILLGTQMIAKGLDFPNVTVVGVVNADTSLHFEDFRAGERTFTLITQVAGRTGRGPRGGRVLVQTFSPEHPAIVAASRHDYATFAKTEMESRRQWCQPPFRWWARFVVRSPNESRAREMARQLGELARQWPELDAESRVIDAESRVIDAGSRVIDAESRVIDAGSRVIDAGSRVMGPAEAPITKLRGEYRFHLVLQSADEAYLHRWISHLENSAPEVDEVRFIVDFDPQEML